MVSTGGSCTINARVVNGAGPAWRGTRGVRGGWRGAAAMMGTFAFVFRESERVGAGMRLARLCPADLFLGVLMRVRVRVRERRVAAVVVRLCWGVERAWVRGQWGFRLGVGVECVRGE